MSGERGGLLKSRAEDFARHLQTRLRSLGGTDDSGGWGEVPATDPEVYYDIDTPLASPQEELPEPIFIAAQNRDDLTLQRSESSGSEYFDTEEDLPPPPSPPVTSTTTTVSFLKKIPILHLKTETPASLTNGHTNILDADLGCSRVHEMPCEAIEQNVNENILVEENNCDNYVTDNNNMWKDKEELIDKVDKSDSESSKVFFNIFTLETNTNTVHDGFTIDVKDTIDVVENTNCVFCDIEQAKSNFSNSSSELQTSQIEDNTSSTSYILVKEQDTLPTENLYLKFPPEPSSECSLGTEGSVQLKDLLQVLKKEISLDSEGLLSSEVEDTKTNECSLASMCPGIEIRESTPTLSTSDIAEAEDKEEEFDIETKRKNFRRCSSLKSGKTPPGTPGRKKIVRFADVMGLDLADVKTFLDEVPTVPKSAYSDLHLQDINTSSPTIVPGPQHERILVPLFQQPCLQPNFMDRVRSNNVCLESAAVSDTSLFAITGMVRVRNIDFHKSVYVRYTINGWRSYSDLQARYIPSSCDGFTDKFSFVLYAHTLTAGQRLEFAVRYHTAGAQFWDSNGGLNYIFECTIIPRTYNNPPVPPSPMETWASFL